VGIELGGLMLTEDGGHSFSDHRLGAQPDVHALAWHPSAPGRAYEAGGGGAAWSTDGGRSWELADEGREHRYVWALAVDPAREARDRRGLHHARTIASDRRRRRVAPTGGHAAPSHRVSLPWSHVQHGAGVGRRGCLSPDRT
jgi:hypothetical protein